MGEAARDKTRQELIDEINKLIAKNAKIKVATDVIKREKNEAIQKSQAEILQLKEERDEAGRKLAETLWEYCDSVKKTDYEALERDHKKALKQIEHDRVKIDELINEIDCKRMELPPEEPIGAAAWLINAKRKRKANAIQRIIRGPEEYEDYAVYSVSDLREIAEHLLAYCKNMESAEAYASDGEDKC